MVICVTYFYALILFFCWLIDFIVNNQHVWRWILKLLPALPKCWTLYFIPIFFCLSIFYWFCISSLKQFYIIISIINNHLNYFKIIILKVMKFIIYDKLWLKNYIKLFILCVCNRFQKINPKKIGKPLKKANIIVETKKTKKKYFSKIF